MANDFRNLASGTIKILDGVTPTPNELTIQAVDGELEFSSRQEQHVVRSRNVPIGYAPGSKQESTLSITVHFREWKSKTSAGASASSIRDFMLGRYTGAASVGDGGDHSFKIQFDLANSGASGDEAESMVWDNCRLVETSFSGDEDTDKLEFEIVSLDWEPTVTRS